MIGAGGISCRRAYAAIHFLDQLIGDQGFRLAKAAIDSSLPVHKLSKGFRQAIRSAETIIAL